MPDKGRERRVEEGCAKLDGLIRRYDERDALEGRPGKKFTTLAEARAWLVEKVGEPNHTPAEIDRRLGKFLKTYGRGDAKDSQDEAGEASHG